MASAKGGPNLIDVFGDSPELVDRLRGPLLQALSGARCSYAVRVDAIGPMGEILVSITGSQGRIPLLFGRGQLEAGHVSSVVQRAVDGTSTAPPPGERAIGLGRSGRVMGTQGGVMHGIDGARPGGTEEREALSLTDPEPRLCLICAELTEELICGTCSARIQGEAIVRKREDERGAAV